MSRQEPVVTGKASITDVGHGILDVSANLARVWGIEGEVGDTNPRL